jgi:phage-related minor tail protein
MANNGISQAVISIMGKLDPSVQKSVNKATKGMGGLKAAAIASTAAIGAAAAAVGAAAVASAKKLLELGSSFDSAYDTIRIGTGATGKALEGLKGDFEKVYAALPTSTESASTAIADLNTRLGVNGKTLQQLSKQAIYLSENLGAGNLQGIIEKTSQAFQGFGIQEDEMSAKMDYLFKVSQSTGIGYEELASKVQQYALTFKDLGYNFEESATLIGQLEKAGVNTDQAMAAMRTSIGKLAAGGKSAAAGFEEYYNKIKNAATATEAANLAAEIFGTRNGAQMARAIRDGSMACGALVKELTNSTESIEGASLDTMDFAEKMQILKNKMNVSLAPLGNSVFDSMNALMPLAEKGINALAKVITKLGKNLPNIVPKVSAVVSKIIDVVKNIIKKVTPIIKTIGSKFVEVFNKIKPIVQEIAVNIGERLGRAFETLKNGISYVKENFKTFAPIIAGVTAALVAYKTITTAISIASKVQATVTTALTAAQAALNAVMNANPIGIICLAIGALVAAGVALYQNWDTIKVKLAALWENIKTTFTNIGAKISEIFNNVKNAVSNGIAAISEKFPIIGVYIDVVKNQIQSSIDAIKGVFTGVIDFVKNVFTGNWQGAWDAVKNIFSSIFDGLAGIVKAPLNGIISIVNKVIGSINGVGFTIPDWVPIVGGKAFKLNIPEIPMFARGGIATEPSIVGEGGFKEYVISTDPQYRLRNIKLLGQAAEELKAKGRSLGVGQAADALGQAAAMVTNNTNTTNNRTTNGGAFKIEFKPVINCNSGSAQDILQALRERMPEFIDMIQGALIQEAEGAW